MVIILTMRVHARNDAKKERSKLCYIVDTTSQIIGDEPRNRTNRTVVDKEQLLDKTYRLNYN